MILKKYKDLKEKYIKDGNVQASEKFWGAAAEAVKEIAEKNKWKHNGHAELFKIINKLSKKSNDEELNALFLVANSLHTNLYENWLTEEQVLEGSKKVKKLIEKSKNSNVKTAENQRYNFWEG